MNRIELVPTLSRCIESTAREEFWNSATRYMEGGRENKELEARIDLLKTFLESADFGKLRSQSERLLLEGKSVRFVICREEGELKYEMIINPRPPGPGEKPTHLPH